MTFKIRLFIMLHASLNRYPRFYARLILRQKKLTNYIIVTWFRYKYNIPIFNKNLPNTDTKGDTCFIIGSGASLNDISEAQWDIIKKNYSIGLNYSFLHKHMPDLHFLELAKDDRGMIDRIIKYKRDNATPPILIKGLVSFSKIPWASKKLDALKGTDNVHLLYESNLPSLVSESLTQAMRFHYDRIKNSSSYRRVFVQSKGSITMVIDAAVQLGYKKLVLLGVDLGGPYFFEHEETNINTGQRNNQLILQNETLSSSSFKEILIFWENYLAENVNVEVFIGSKKSMLYPDLKYYW